MKLKCFDKYRQQHLIMEVTEDELWELDSFSSNYCTGRIQVKFTIVDGEDPRPKRWSDLTEFEIIKDIPPNADRTGDKGLIK